MADPVVDTTPMTDNTEPDFTPVMIYGIVADVMVILPIILYMVLSDTTNMYNQYHQTMINMLTSAWMPFAITWIIVMASDSPMARTALTGALTMAGLGPFALQWVGLMAFIMAAHDAVKLGESENLIFLFLYIGGNIGTVVMHWMLSASVQDWIVNAPFATEEAPMEEVAVADEEAEEGDEDF